MNNKGVDILVIRCHILANSYKAGRILTHAPALMVDNIVEIISQAVFEINLCEDVMIDRLIVDLGEIALTDFDTQFASRLQQSLMENLFKHCEQAIKNTEIPGAECASAMPLLMRAPSAASDEAIFSQALCCLQPAALSGLLLSRQPEQRRQLLHQLSTATEAAYVANGGLPGRRISNEQLCLAALGYLLSHERGRRWLSEHYPDISLFSLLESAVADGDISGYQALTLLDLRHLTGIPAQRFILAHRWLLPLWQKTAVRQAIGRQAGKACLLALENGYQPVLRQLGRRRGKPDLVQPEQETHGLPVSNAGLTLLWPLLPDFFSQMQLCQNGGFISEDARWQAVLLLDLLAWGEADELPPPERLALSQMLCGVEVREIPQLSPLTCFQQQLATEWLSAVSQQLPGWGKLTLTDIRQLWLQRRGDVLLNMPAAHIIIQPEPFDYLLGEWPWPLTLMQFSWLPQPLTLTWPLHNQTG